MKNGLIRPELQIKMFLHEEWGSKDQSGEIF